MRFGAMIKAAREAAHLTQEQLGELIGVSGVSIMRYEKEQRNPRFEQLAAIADALNVDLTEWIVAATAQAYEEGGLSLDAAIRRHYGIKNDSSYTVISVDDAADDMIDSLLKAYAKLNDAGRERAMAYILDLSGNPNYQTITEE